VLTVEDLSFAYRRGGEELFAGLSHRFAAGRITAVTGPSGRGKSTLLYLLGLLLRPAAGRVVIEGVAAQSLPDAARSRLRARRIGFVFQDAALDPTRTVLDAVLEPALYAGVPRRDALSRAHRLLTEFGVLARADHRPGEISGGQAQRVALCRCLLNDPPIILADEPTGNLDRDNAVTVLDALRVAAGAGRTVVIATHDPFVLDRVDEVLDLGGPA
jgi:putative ABC transport system ATP-binding protein/lipoprotein-releasing system ATP-binding protein